MDAARLISNKVTLLMAAYNGERYIARQIESILNQTHTNWELIVRDDGSDDDTVTIIKKYAAADERIVLINAAGKIKSACGNFAALYTWVKSNRNAGYLMFTDQDDIWKPEKIEKTLILLLKAENKNPGMPVMSYGNLKLVDDTEQSLPDQIHLLKDMKLRHLLTRNYAFGCTIMLNSTFIKAMNEIDANAQNHDYWVALFGVTFGKTVFINEYLILYRQHDKNVSGHGIGNQQLNNRVKRYTSEVDKQVRGEEERLNTIERFYRQYNSAMPRGNKQLIYNYLDSFNKGRLAVIANMAFNRIVRKGMVQTLVSYYFILLFYKKIKYKFNRV